MSTGRSVFIIGAGFIGWNVLELLVQEEYKVTALVRRAEQASQLSLSGANTVFGTLDDTDLITAHAAQHDIIIHTATADHKPSALAVCEAAKQRARAGKSTIYIHTSGTSVLDDDANGAFEGTQIFHDSQPAAIDALPDTAPHRPIDLAVVAAARELGSAATFAIMTPPLIYGFNRRHGRLSIQIPTLTRFALKHGFAGYVGAGKAVESQIHVLDLARAYIVLLHRMEAAAAAVGNNTEFLENPYVFCENGRDVAWRDVATMIGRALHAVGKIEDPEPRTVPREMWGDLFGEVTPAVVGLNSRSRAVRLRKWGWEPREGSMEESFVTSELPEILKEDLGDFKGYLGTAA